MGVWKERRPAGADSPDIVISNEELCTVGSDHAVISWVTSAPCSAVTVYIGENPARMTGFGTVSNSRYHQVELTGLKPDTVYWYQVTSGRAKGSLNSFRTLPAGGGKQLFKFAVISDAHVPAGSIFNDVNKIYLGKLTEYADVLLVRSIRDVKKRGVDLVVFTGDLTDTATRRQYRELRYRLLPHLGGTPFCLCPGNHDKFTRYGGVGEEGFYEYLSGRRPAWREFFFREHQFLLLDSCRPDDNWGFMGEDQLQWLEQRLHAGGGRPAFIFLHHPSHGFDLWFGLKNHRDLLNIIKKFPAVRGVFCGHMHRSKVTRYRAATGDVPFVEVPATVQYPCACAVVKVCENGFEYNAYKLTRPDLSEKSRERFILKNGGRAVFTRYSFGGLGDRSFAFYGGVLYRPRLYELSVTFEHEKAVALYERLRLDEGASLAPAEAGRTRVVLGRFATVQAAFRARRRKFSLYQVKARIVEEGDVREQIDISD